MKTPQFYGPDSPAVGSVVLVEVVDDLEGLLPKDAIPVILLEYGNVRGCILHQEVSAPRKKASKVRFQSGKRFPAQILRIDVKDDGRTYIDLSKRAIDYPDKIDACILRHKKAVLLNHILSDCSKRCNLDAAKVIRQVAWPCYSDSQHALDNIFAMCGSCTPNRNLCRICNNDDLASAIHKSIRGLRMLVGTDDADVNSDLIERISESCGMSPKRICEGVLELEIKAAFDDATKKLSAFDVLDVLDTVHAQITTLSHQFSCSPHDCMIHIVGCVVDAAMTATFAKAGRELKRPTDAPCTVSYAIDPRDWSPDLAKQFLAEVKKTMTLWAPLIRKLCDQYKIELIADRPPIARGQFELLCFVAEFCSQDFALALPCFFQDLTFVLYHGKKIDLIDEDTILAWEAYVTDNADKDDDCMLQLLQDIRPLTEWLTDAN